MATSGRGTGIVGYNVQTAVDAKHHLIVAHEVTNVGHDRDSWPRWRSRRQGAAGAKELIALADRGYYEGYEILECEQAGIAALVPKPMTSNNLAGGLFDKRDFRYDAKRDRVPVPGGRIAIYRFTTTRTARRCTSTGRRTARSVRSKRMHDEASTGASPAGSTKTYWSGFSNGWTAAGGLRLRRQTVEHVFGTLKAWMGSTHFLTRTLPRVRTEMSLQVLAYNLKRAIKILGVAADGGDEGVTLARVPSSVRAIKPLPSAFSHGLGRYSPSKRPSFSA